MKVLYSFDNENKTNCLARWPEPLNIRTAYLEENIQIGVIDLKTCVQAIVAASPELVAKLGQDYTVYAYDYSEYETPLVGQGMLSWVLASSSSTPSAPAHQSRTIVTGRVCKNILGLFSSSSQETLEVKLRLVPVPTSLQSEYLESMKKYRDISQIMPVTFDPQAWTNFIQANPNFFQLATQSRSQSPAVGGGQTNGFGIEHVQRLMTGDGFSTRNTGSKRSPTQNNTHSTPNLSQNSNYPPPSLPQHNSYSAPAPPQNSTQPCSESSSQLPRPSSAASNISTAAAPKRRGRPPRDKNAPRGRGGRAKKFENIQPSGEAGYTSNNEGFEEGPNQKRAKVTQTEWSGRMDFGKQPESLRVAASTAASVRIHQPTATRPGNHLANALEGPPREPTPIADPSNRTQRPQLPIHKSSLRREAFVSEPKSYASPYTSIKPAGSDMTSPEASQAESSPIDITSSPPIYRGASTAPSSPNLPTLRRQFVDSSFMDSSLDDLFEDDEMRPISNEDIEIASHYSRRPNLPVAPVRQTSAPQNSDSGIGFEQPTVPEDLDAKAAAQTRQIARNARLLSRTASSGNIVPPPVPASDPIRPSTLNRSQTWSGNQAPHPASDFTPLPPVMKSIERPVSRNRKGSDGGMGSGARRRQAIQSKLASSVAAGEMPPFCENCGAIETPTWRKAWVKIHTGTPEHVVISEEEGGVIAWQTLQTDPKGNICLYRIIKKSTLRNDVGFTEVLLCNPCGLFLHTRRCMRPKEVWERPPNGGDGKRRRDGNSGARQKSNSISEPAANGTTLHSDASTPVDGGQTEGLEAEPHLPSMQHRRLSSVHTTSSQKTSWTLNDASALAALERAIKSSPHKFVGSEHIPIEVEDLTPHPTRRILFPSPSQSQKARSTRNSIAGSDAQDSQQQASSSIPDADADADQANKENCPPANEDDDLDQFFEEDAYINAHNARAATPTLTSSGRAMSFKTPKRSPGRLPPTTGDFFSSAAKALLRPPVTLKRTPTKDPQPLSELTPFTAHLNQLLSDANSGSPGSQNFDFPSLPSLHNTPGRHMRSIDFDFSQFDSQDLLSTDVPMPSSPPAWFGVYEDPVEYGTGNLWGDDQLPGSGTTPIDEVVDGKSPKTPGLIVDENGTATIDMQAMA